MKKIDNNLKHQIFGGFSFWTFAMGASLLFNVAVQGIGSLINLAKSQYVPKNTTNSSHDNLTSDNNNSWALGYNRYGNGSSIMLRFGLRPDKAGMLTTLPLGAY